MWSCDPAVTAPVLSSYYAAGPLFVQALQTMFAAQCALVGDHVWPADATDAVLKDPNYDFIVVGAGSAGSVVANRLSEIPDWKVLLIEAGGNPTLASEAPLLFYNNMKTDNDWEYYTEPQGDACLGYKGQRCFWPRGKILGGSSSINAMFYVRGNKADFDGWAASGNQGWSYEDVLPYYIKSENFSGPWNDERKKYYGSGGYLNVNWSPEPQAIEKVFLDASVEMGIKTTESINKRDSQMGATLSAFTTLGGVRQSTARAYLAPVKNRKNLHVLKKALVKKLLFKPNTNEVSGVVVNKDGKDLIINVKKEIVLSAGALNSPQLLMLSGIGPRKHLESLNIDVKKDLPVGENLQDHLVVPIYFKKKGDSNSVNLEIVTKGFLEFILNQSGPFSSLNDHRVISFINTTDPNSDTSDIQFHHLVYLPGMFKIIDVYDYHGLGEEFNEKVSKVSNDNYLLKIFVTLLRPKSRGKILLKSKNASDHPLLFPNYFKDPEDMQTTIRGIKQAIKYKTTQAMKDFGFKIQWIELNACKDYKLESDEHLECISRHLISSLYHPVGTAKMGPENDKTSVVSPQLKVHGVKGIRVIDASIMPTIVRGNTNAPTIMIGEKGADLIKEEWLTNKHTEL